MTENALVVKELTKAYGNTRAVDRISFSIKRGTVFCLVGPNGAGKTTTMEIIEGLKKPDSGEIRLFDLQLPDELARARHLMGVQLQTTSLFDRLRVGEIVNLFRSFYSHTLPTEQVLETVSLQSKKEQMVAELSGGQQQRVAIALALLNDPEILFLDEPTAGLDPQARREVWKLVDSLKQRGKTIFLTTHYMDEAEKLSDEVAIIDRGRIIAHDTPRSLVSKLNKANVVEFSTEETVSEETLSRLNAVTAINIVGKKVVLYTSDVKDCMVELLAISRERGIGLRDMQFRSPSLEDVFIELTGEMLRE